MGLYFMIMVNMLQLLEWKLMIKSLLKILEKHGRKMELTKLSYETFCELFEDELYIKYMETGAYYELREEDWLELEYDAYNKNGAL